MLNQHCHIKTKTRRCAAHAGGRAFVQRQELANQRGNEPYPDRPHTPVPTSLGLGEGEGGRRRPLGAAGPLEIRSTCEKAAEMGFCAYMKSSSCQALLKAPWGCLGEVHTSVADVHDFPSVLSCSAWWGLETSKRLFRTGTSIKSCFRGKGGPYNLCLQPSIQQSRFNSSPRPKLLFLHSWSCHLGAPEPGAYRMMSDNNHQ